jgi:hypothetical protein
VYRGSLLKLVANELIKHELDLVGVHEVGIGLVGETGSE